MDRFQPPWSNPPSTPTLDFANGGASIPPEVSAAIGRFRMGASDERDRQVLVQYLIANQTQMDPQEAQALGSIIGAMGGSGPQGASPAAGPGVPWSNPPGTPTLDWANRGLGAISDMTPWAGSISAPASLPTPQGEDWRSQEQGASAPPSLPTPAPPGTPQSMLASVTPPSQSMPSMPPVTGADLLPGGVGASNAQQREARQGRRGGNDNWKHNEFNAGMGVPATSAFAPIMEGRLPTYATAPGLAANRIAGGSMAGAAQIQPYVEAGLNLAQMGSLGQSLHGREGRGLGGGPQNAADQLALTENLVNSMGPGTQVDPRAIYRDAMHRAGRTPVESMNTGQGTAGDEDNQIRVTGGALMNAGAFMTPDAKDALANQINVAAMQWLDRRNQGDTISFPEYLRSVGAQRWVGKRIQP